MTPEEVLQNRELEVRWVLDPYIPLNTKFQINYLRDEKFT